MINGRITLTLLSIVITMINSELETPVLNVHKVSMTQKGYIQFMKYKVEVPPLSQFTFCMWMKSQNLTYPHPLLSYSKHERDRYIRSQISAGGRRLKLTILEQKVGDVLVELEHYIWHHICQSWDSNTGHWQMYLDGRLTGDGINKALRGIIIPGGGDIVVGQEYTDFDKGLEDGIEGDVFGFNMILSSTTEEPNHKYYHRDSKNYLQTLDEDINTDTENAYIRLADLETNSDNAKIRLIKPIEQITPTRTNSSNGYHGSEIEDEDSEYSSFETPVNDVKLTYKERPEGNITASNMPFWSVINQAGREGKFKKSNADIQSLALTNLPIYETPPALPIYEDSPKNTQSFEVLYSQKHFKGNQWYDQNDYFPKEFFKTWKFKPNKQRHNRHRQHHKQKPINKDLFPYPSENVQIYVTENDHSIFKRETRQGEKNVEILNPKTILFYPVSVKVYPRAGMPGYSNTENMDVPVEDRLKNHNLIDKENNEDNYEVLYSKLHYTGPQIKNRLVYPDRETAENVEYNKIANIRDKLKNEREEYDTYAKSLKLARVLKELYRQKDDEYNKYEQDRAKTSPIYIFEDVNVNNHKILDRLNSKQSEEESLFKTPKSAGRKLVELSYKKCLLDRGAPLAKDSANLISWTLTPLKVFGGAIIKRATPQCGLF